MRKKIGSTCNASAQTSKLFREMSIVFQENKSYQTCQVFKTWQVLKLKYLSEHVYSPLTIKIALAGFFA